MELSKLNISSIAKEEIRRRFFDSRSAKNKTSAVSDSPGEKLVEDIRPIAEKESHEAKQEQEKPQIPPNLGEEITTSEDEITASEDDGFPLITSVFSLASSSSETGDDGCGSADEICVSNKPARTLQNITCPTVHSSSNVKKESLSFVVKCGPQGVITVCSPPNPISTSCNFKDDRQDSIAITSSVEKSICSSEKKTVPNTTTCSLPISITASNSTMVTFIDATQQIVVPVDKPRSEVEKYLKQDNCVILNNVDIPCPAQMNENEVPNRVPSHTTKSSISEVQSVQKTNEIQSKLNVATERSLKTTIVLPSNVNIVDSSDEKRLAGTESNTTENEPTDAAHSSVLSRGLNDEKTIDELSIKEEEHTEQPFITKQEEKIRQLKDLLRQKEAELEKFRFKGKAGPVSRAAQLRENFLRKNPSLCRRSQRLSRKEETESNEQVAAPESTNKDKRLPSCDKSEKIVSSETDSCSENEMSEKDSSSEREMFEKGDTAILTTTSEPKSTKFTEQDKYKFVNVTVFQGHTRTLAVPVENEKNSAVSMANNALKNKSDDGKVTSTMARKRKQERPKKFGRNCSKRKSNKEDDVTNENILGQGNGSKRVKQLSPVSSESSKPQYHKETCPTGPNTRLSPRRREWNRSCKNTSVKRKSESNNESQSVPSKAPRTSIVTTSKASGKVTSSSSIASRAALTLAGPRAICSTELTTSSAKSTTRPIATITSSACTTTQNDPALNPMVAVQSAKPGTIGKKIAYVLHTNGAGGETTHKDTNRQSSGAANSEIVKRVVESMSRQVFAIVSNEPGSGTGSKKGCESNVSSITSPLSETKASAQQSALGYATSGANSCSISGCTKRNAPTSSPKSSIAVPVKTNRLTSQNVNNTTSEPTQRLPVSRCQNKEVQNEEHDTTKSVRKLTAPLMKNNIAVSVTSSITSVISSCNLSNPERSAVETSKKCNLVSIASNVGAPIPATKTNIHDQISIESPRSVGINSPASLVSGNQITAVISGTNKQANGNNYTVSPLKALTVGTSAPVAKSESFALITRTLPPKPSYTVATVAVPVAIAGSATNTSNAYVFPAKNLPNATPKPRPIAPKPTSPQNKSNRLLAPKPASNQITIPQPKSLTPESSQCSESVGITPDPQPIVSNPALIQGTSGNIVVSHVTLPQSVVAKRKTCESVNPVINVLPKPLMAVSTSSTGFPQNLNSGKIVVYDVVQSHLSQAGTNTSVASKDGPKLVVYVSNTGETRNLGIIKENKIYLNSSQDTTLENPPKLKSPVTKSASEFIPNPEDKDFKVLLGLEHVVDLLK